MIISFDQSRLLSSFGENFVADPTMSIGSDGFTAVSSPLFHSHCWNYVCKSRKIKPSFPNQVLSQPSQNICLSEHQFDVTRAFLRCNLRLWVLAVPNRYKHQGPRPSQCLMSQLNSQQAEKDLHHSIIRAPLYTIRHRNVKMQHCSMNNKDSEVKIHLIHYIHRKLARRLCYQRVL